MLSTEEKLQRFSESVYQDAQNRCNELIKQAEEKASAETDAYETACLEEAYHQIKKQMAQIVRSANETVSKAEIDAKSALLLKREEIIKEVFAGVLEKIAAYKQTEAYLTDLVSAAKAAKEQGEENGITVSLSKSDAHLASAVAEQSGANVTVSDTDDLIGGICVLINNTNKVLDMSFAAKLRDAKEQFLKSSGLTL